ncbi:hypothetical protein BKA64DRAFT_727452 [Cadophora sp. MPI-SDFR-AT-0126]|nr:hypothetical protein BKA64DRAFT_727452 [Leotiomycetes sp. MPI-SDFR-AT-0126]
MEGVAESHGSRENDEYKTMKGKVDRAAREDQQSPPEVESDCDFNGDDKPPKPKNMFQCQVGFHVQNNCFSRLMTVFDTQAFSNFISRAAVTSSGLRDRPIPPGEMHAYEGISGNSCFAPRYYVSTRISEPPLGLDKSGVMLLIVEDMNHSFDALIGQPFIMKHGGTDLLSRVTQVSSGTMDSSVSAALRKVKAKEGHKKLDSNHKNEVEKDKQEYLASLIGSGSAGSSWHIGSGIDKISQKNTTSFSGDSGYYSIVKREATPARSSCDSTALQIPMQDTQTDNDDNCHKVVQDAPETDSVETD